MNYRHAFHAGNFGDVLKHVVLARIIEHLKEKPKPFRVIDTHAGTGLYDLRADAAERTGEWQAGVGRLYAPATGEALALDEAEGLLEPWRKAVASVNNGASLTHYPGSPEIVRRLLRESDRMLLNELHPEDHEALARRFGRDDRVRVTRIDAWAALKANLPPLERRALVLIDPPYEAPGEAKRAVAALADAHRRFATGVFALWYPVKGQAEANDLARRVAALALPKTLLVELTVRRADLTDRLNGSGLVLVNPPWKLEGELRTLLPALARRLADKDARFPGGWRLQWLVGEDDRPGEK